jgi:hypothetical protein
MSSMLSSFTIALSLSKNGLADSALIDTVYSGSGRSFLIRVLVLKSGRIRKSGFMLVGRIHIIKKVCHDEDWQFVGR